jgi:hypothetical protein
MRCVVEADAGVGAAWTAWHRETAATSGEYPIPRDARPGEIARQLVNDLKLRVFPDQFSGFS